MMGPPSSAIRKAFGAKALRILLGLLASTAAGASPSGSQLPAAPPRRDLVITHAHLITVTHGEMDDATVWVHDGKIAGFGKTVIPPAGADVVDAKGRLVTPGIVDGHSHVGLIEGSDMNETSDPITPQIYIQDALSPTASDIYFALAGGVTSEMILPGSSNIVAGHTVAIKNKVGLPLSDMVIPGAPSSMKFACGENVKHTYGGRAGGPATRMALYAQLRQAFSDARAYRKAQDDFLRNPRGKTAPPRDLRLDALSDILNGRTMVQIHCFRADEMLAQIRISKEFGYKIRAFHHALEAYKIADILAAEGIGVITSTDWWAGKAETADGIPWAPGMDRAAGIHVALHSDSSDVVRRLNQEAAKNMRYNGFSRNDALSMITLEGAWIMGLQDRIGSIDRGKDGDLVIWQGDPLSTYGRAQKVFIEGRLYFDADAPGLGLTVRREEPR